MVDLIHSTSSVHVRSLSRFGLACLCAFGLSACQQPATNPSAAPVSDSAAPSQELSVAGDDFSTMNRVCQSKDDCVQFISFYFNEKGSCCQSCSYEVLEAGAAKAAKEACSAMAGEGCPMKKCVGPPKFDCVDNTCVNLPR